MNQLTTYNIKSRADGFVWVFKYHLNGALASFEILDGALNSTQRKWLFENGHFPAVEAQIKDWQKKMRANFEVTVGEPDLSFDAFWQAYGHKTRKKQTEAYFKKMSQADRFKAFLGIRRYNNHLQLNSWKTKVDPIRFLKDRRYEDEY